MIDRVVNRDTMKKAARRFKEKGILLPTFSQMRNPELVPEDIKAKLKTIGLWELNPANLFRITWKNEPTETGGGYGKVNYIEIPREITGVRARIFMMVGKYFPTGAHKVGAAYGCLAPRIITGQFDPEYHKAVWPSTGNYCRGGAFDSYLMGVTAVAILPQEMSRERFEWLKEIGAEVYATPGCESNVKEIYDKCWEIRRTKPDHIILNQFDEFGNPVWHYNVTGPAIEEIYSYVKTGKSRLSAFISNTGSAGTIAAGDYLKSQFPALKVVASEALQCPTLLNNGFGGHRIEGIGDKHVPWVHNVKNTDVVTAIDDEDCMRAIRLFNEPDGKKFLANMGIDEATINKLNYLGISGVANLISAIKTAKYYEMDENDVIISIATDSMDMYGSRLEELRSEKGEYSEMQAGRDFEKSMLAASVDYLKELTYTDQKAIHNLKYFTWIEQQEKPLEELNQQWYDHEIWPTLFNQVAKWDELIEEFNQEVKNA
ncbi:MAG: pyridoxal-5-phosphate-dependent protein subunit beta [Bacteroidetes bacterium HGW-Bacteroidetes-6]|nr:MAG: pyridoxal-5-phosphate-dependent protein subunit beta [Bacteroidetes bacterium HGW-Bacteroidetes-6]